MFVRKYVIPALAVAGMALAVYTVRSENQPVKGAAPVSPPASSPFDDAVAGAGLVEASTQNIAIGTHVGGIVTTLHVKVGDKVKAGDPLFTVDDRTVRAQVAVAEAGLAVAEQTLARLKGLPRKEDVPPAQARVDEATVMLDDMRSQLDRMEKVEDPRAIVLEELTRRRFAVASARTRLAENQAALSLLLAGAWAPDLAVAEAQIRSARAQVDAAKTELDRHTVKAPVDGQILQLNLRLGEFVNTGVSATAPILMGGTDVLHVRVDVDENDAWRVRPGAEAAVFIRGNSKYKTTAKFVRIEPFVVPKRSLTGESTERVDTRVLQILFAFEPSSLGVPVYAGQQMDVYIKAQPREAGGAN